jgi:hypothetical protein
VFTFNSVIALIVVRPKVAPRKSGAFIEWEAFKELPYLLYAIGIFLSLWGLYFAYFYASFSYSTDVFVFLTCYTIATRFRSLAPRFFMSHPHRHSISS